MVASSARHMHQKNLRGDGGGGDGGGDNLDDGPKDSEAPSEKDSELARFLLCGGDGDNAEDARSMRSVNAGWYALALEPLEVRNERIIMLFEGYALFGALFMNAVWVIYEWGNYHGYDSNAALSRTFQCVMGVALCCNIFLALYGAACWMMSIMMDASNEHFVFECRTMLTILQNLLMFLSQLTSLGLFMAAYMNLYPNLPEVIITVSIAVLAWALGGKYFGRHMATCMPLEFFHFPFIVQLMSGPSAVLGQSGRTRLRARAKQRAGRLSKRAFGEGTTADPGDPGWSGASSSPSRRTFGSVGELLRAAAIELGRVDDDVSAYEKRLEDDWFNQADQLRGRSVDCLAKYMPLRLAEEVHKLVGE